MNSYPVDSLVSALGDVYPQLGIGRHVEDSESSSAIMALLLSWAAHLDYEGSSYVLEGYHIQAEAAELLAGRGFEVVALGYRSINVQQKCAEIREHAIRGDWTSSIKESELSGLIVRYIEESRMVERQCLERGLAYFDVSDDAEAALGRAEAHLVRGIQESS